MLIAIHVVIMLTEHSLLPIPVLDEINNTMVVSSNKGGYTLGSNIFVAMVTYIIEFYHIVFVSRYC